MNVLIACESSQTVCKAFRDKGHNAFSCDIASTYGELPQYHIQDDVLKLLNGNIDFYTEAGQYYHIIGNWDFKEDYNISVNLIIFNN